MNTVKRTVKKPVIVGIIGGLALLAVYFTVLSAANSFSHAIEHFTEMWYWVSGLVIGFGIQAGLYSYVRKALREKSKTATAEIAATGSISTGSMIACCAHHVTDVLPILGVSAATVFLLEYQVPFIILGLASNVVGITMIATVIQKHGLFDKQEAFSRVFKYNIRFVRNLAAIIGVLVVFTAFVSTSFNTDNTGYTVASDNGLQTTGNSLELSEQVNKENGLSIEVKPIGFEAGKPVSFEIGLNTHQGSLDYDMTIVSMLEDSEGKDYAALSWKGSPPGGHHRSGVLTFPSLGETKSMKLTIRDVYGVRERMFLWELG